MTIADEGTDQASLQIGIVNNSNKSVLSYEFSATNGEYFANRGTDGTIASDTPQVAIAPHGYATFTWSLGSI